MKKIRTICRWIKGYPLFPAEQNFIDDMLFDIKLGGLTIIIMMAIALITYFIIDSFNQPLI
jgi:hypothetical protein